jgi:hypothetical protein
MKKNKEWAEDKFVFVLVFALIEFFLLITVAISLTQPRYEYCKENGFWGQQEKAEMQQQIFQLGTDANFCFERLAKANYDKELLKALIVNRAKAC